MKKILISIFIFIVNTYTNAQIIKVAILDFENVSGIAKYDGLGKAMSSMLITDIEANVSPKRLQLVERSQIQKILKEQNFQASAAVDKNSTVKAGKILGVNYLLLGDIYVFDDALIINARFVDAENGNIKFSTKQEGKLQAWLNLKTNIAKELSANLSMPFSSPSIPDIDILPVTLTTFANAVKAKDENNVEKAEEYLGILKELIPNFSYTDDIQLQLEEVKKSLQNIQKTTEDNKEEIVNIKNEIQNSTIEPVKVALNLLYAKDFENSIKYLKYGLLKTNNINFGDKYLYYNLLAEVYFQTKDYANSINYTDSVLMINPIEPHALFIKIKSLLESNKYAESVKLFNYLIENIKLFGNSDIILKSLYDYSNKNKGIVFKGMTIYHNIMGGVSFEHRINGSFQDFKDDVLPSHLGPNDEVQIQKITSNDYDFPQVIFNNDLLRIYLDILNKGHYKYEEIARKIDELSVPEPSKGPYRNPYNSANLVYGNTIAGMILDSNLYVLANSGIPYSGNAHFGLRLRQDDSYWSVGFYSSKNSKVQLKDITITQINDSSLENETKIIKKAISKPIVKHNDLIDSFPIKFGINNINMVISRIECPCEVLIDRESYNEIQKNKTSFSVNTQFQAEKAHKSGWYYLLGASYEQSIDRNLAVINWFINKGRRIDGKWLTEHDYDYYMAAIINLGHTYLLMGDYKNAQIQYNSIVLKQHFGSEWGFLSVKESLKADWKYFIDLKLISSDVLNTFLSKHPEIND